MKLTVLGCWAPFQAVGGACSGYLLQVGEKNILLDCGNGVLGNLQKYINYRHIDAVILSHLHPDHYCDLFSLRHAIGGARRIDKNIRTIPVLAPENPAEEFKKICKFTEAFDVQSIDQIAPVSINGVKVRSIDFYGIKISFIPTKHSLPTYAIEVEEKGKLFYTGDTGWMEYLPVLAADSDVLLCEASLAEKDKANVSVGHLTASQAGELGRKAGAKKLVLTHFQPEYNLNTLNSEAENSYGNKVIMAQEGLEVEIK